jgi:hypothetical protein
MSTSHPSRWPMVLAAGIAVLATLVALVAVSTSRARVVEQAVTRFSIVLPTAGSLFVGTNQSQAVAISPDGRRLVAGHQNFWLQLAFSRGARDWFCPLPQWPPDKESMGLSGCVRVKHGREQNVLRELDQRAADRPCSNVLNSSTWQSTSSRCASPLRGAGRSATVAECLLPLQTFFVRDLRQGSAPFVRRHANIALIYGDCHDASSALPHRGERFFSRARVATAASVDKHVAIRTQLVHKLFDDRLPRIEWLCALSFRHACVV